MVFHVYAILGKINNISQNRDLSTVCMLCPVFTESNDDGLAMMRELTKVRGLMICDSLYIWYSIL